jgi:Trypsin-co-occurring domain 1
MNLDDETGEDFALTDLVRFPFGNGLGFVVVEVDDGGGAVYTTSVADSRIAGSTFEAAVSKLKPIAEAVREQIKDLAPNAVKIELGVKFSADVGIILAKSSAEGTCKVTIDWKPSAEDKLHEKGGSSDERSS